MITNCGYTGEIEITDSINNEKSKNDMDLTMLTTRFGMEDVYKRQIQSKDGKVKDFKTRKAVEKYCKENHCIYCEEKYIFYK